MINQQIVDASIAYSSGTGYGEVITETDATYILISEQLVITDGERQTLDLYPRLRSEVINGEGGMKWILERSGNVVTAELVASIYQEQEKVTVANEDIPQGLDDNDNPIPIDPVDPVTFELIRPGSREGEGFAIKERRLPILVEVTESTGEFTLTMKVKGYAGMSCAWTIANMNLY